MTPAIAQRQESPDGQHERCGEGAVPRPALGRRFGQRCALIEVFEVHQASVFVVHAPSVADGN